MLNLGQIFTPERPNRNPSTANNFTSLNIAVWKTQTLHTVRFKITTAQQVESLFTASPHWKNISTATPQIAMSPLLRYIYVASGKIHRWICFAASWKSHFQWGNQQGRIIGKDYWLIYWCYGVFRNEQFSGLFCHRFTVWQVLAWESFGWKSTVSSLKQ